MPHSSGDWKVRKDQRYQLGLGLRSEPDSGSTDGHPLTESLYDGIARELLGDSFIRALILLHKSFILHDLIGSPKVPTSKYYHTREKVSTYEFWEDTIIQSTALSFPKTQWGEKHYSRQEEARGNSVSPCKYSNGAKEILRS